ncbi:MAG TPA: hypothetical protein VHQ46_00255, partial [Desulfobacteria bacterium]|nr:hypothetical protein [Desulfobacteria bacterium]
MLGLARAKYLWKKANKNRQEGRWANSLHIARARSAARIYSWCGKTDKAIDILLNTVAQNNHN